ncbi:hypothetical protein GCM10011335_08470 [Aureimonas glaciei]|uniref:Propionyl-coenzyme A carboxylase alpha polypeptide n=1 Tax=Aureimonas glaciei TaxID=1776957 RepID=A0A916XTD0_9HYPH|nr:hypothetical protein GCM10011335_08470 [Aureimonas glaciei]
MSRPPLPAGISPSRGEIRSVTLCDKPISPLEGEMAGRPEGGERRRPTRTAIFVMPQMSPCDVSQAATLPSSKPRLNQVWRCAEVPWLKLSGTT